MGTSRSDHRRRFEKDTLPHLDSLWRTALWLTKRRSSAENLVLKTMTQAYRSWPGSNCTIGSRQRLFRLLTTRFFDAGNARRRPGRFLREHFTMAADSGEGDLRSSAALIGREQLMPITTIPGIYVRSTVSRLRPLSRLVMLLFLHEQFSRAEIAYITDLQKDSVKAILGRLRRLIPRYLVRHVNSFVTVEGNHATLPVPQSQSGDARCGG